jgi:hypothetical protein
MKTMDKQKEKVLRLMIEDCDVFIDNVAFIEERTLSILKRAEKIGVPVEQYNGGNLLIALDELRSNIEAYLEGAEKDK